MTNPDCISTAQPDRHVDIALTEKQSPKDDHLSKDVPGNLACHLGQNQW